VLSASATFTDFSSCTRCAGVRTVGLQDFRQRLRGRPFRWLIEYHLRHHDASQVEAASNASLASLPGKARPAALDLVEAHLDGLEESALWERDAGRVIGRMEREARSRLEERRIPPSPDLLFDMVELVVLSFVEAARESEQLRRRMGVHLRGPLERHRWNVVAVIAGGALLLWTSRPAWVAVGWALVGLALLPPLARAVARRSEGEIEGEVG